MNPLWEAVAQRIVEGAGVQAGELVQVRDHTGRLDVLDEVLLAIERKGAVPLPEFTSVRYRERLLAETSIEFLAQWDRYRREWMEQFHRIITLEGAPPNYAAVPPEALHAWMGATNRLTEREEARQLPFLLVAIPTEQQAQRLGLTLNNLEAVVLPAVAVSAATLQDEIRRVFDVVAAAEMLTLRTGMNDELRMIRGGRALLSDDGAIDEEDRARGAIVSNLPGGSIYTTVEEAATEGTVWLAEARTARNVRFTFRNGRIEAIEAGQGQAELEALFAQHTGEPGRVSHIGIGLNPHLDRFIGWTLVDEHVYGALFLALGENRYMGGQNESSLNIDFALADATLLADDRVVLDGGRVVV